MGAAAAAGQPGAHRLAVGGRGRRERLGRRARRRFADCYGEFATALCAGAHPETRRGLRGGVGPRGGPFRQRAVRPRRTRPRRGRTGRRAPVGHRRARPGTRLSRARRPPLRPRGARPRSARRRAPRTRPAPPVARLVRGRRPRSRGPVPRGLRRPGRPARSVRPPFPRRAAAGDRVRGPAALALPHGTRAPRRPVRTLLAAFHGRLAAETYRRAAVDHARQRARPPLAGTLRCRPCQAPHGPPGHGRRAFRRSGGDAGVRRSADPRLGRPRGAGEGPGLAAARLRGDPQGRARGAPAGRRHAVRPRGRGLPRALQGPGRTALPRRGRRSARRGPQPGLLRGDRRAGTSVPRRRDASAALVVLSSVVEGFPAGLVEAMFCGRATVSTDVGAVVEAIGGTGLVVPPRNPRALAEACVALLRDPERRERLGAAARARALELFTVEQNIAAFHGIYLEILSRTPVRRVLLDDMGAPLPFGDRPRPTSRAGRPRPAHGWSRADPGPDGRRDRRSGASHSGPPREPLPPASPCPRGRGRGERTATDRARGRHPGSGKPRGMGREVRTVADRRRGVGHPGRRGGRDEGRRRPAGRSPRGGRAVGGVEGG